MVWMNYVFYAMLMLVPIHNVDTACPEKDRLPRKCDYIVVGSGAAGATIASRLSENPNINVCLFEAGIRDTEGQFANSYTIPRMLTALIPGDITWNTTTLAQKGLNNRILSNGMGKVLGGSTTHNAMAYFRGFKADFDYWADNGAPGWDFKSNLPFFLKSENMTIEELRNSPLHSTCGPLTISYDETTFDTPLAKLWHNTAKELSIPVGECNRPTPFGLCGLQATVKNGKRESTATAFLHPVMGRRNLFVVTEALVVKILIFEETKRAYGIRYLKHNSIYTVRAHKEVIVSAGTFESPKLLQLSGIGPKALLQRLKKRPHVILPVGQAFMDHMAFFIDLDITTRVTIRADLLNPETVGQYLFKGKGLWGIPISILNLFLDIVKQKHNWPEMQINLLDSLVEANPSIDDRRAGFLLDSGTTKTGATLLMLLSHPKSRGTVEARSTDPEDLPLIDPKFFSYFNDVDIFIKGIRMIQKIIKSSPSMRKAGAELRTRGDTEKCVSETELDSDSFWECVLREQTGAGLHPVRSCPIGRRNDRWAVVDPELRVYGIKGLRVADASVMPEVSSGNAVGPTIMIGERAAEFILNDYVRRRKY